MVSRVRKTWERVVAASAVTVMMSASAVVAAPTPEGGGDDGGAEAAAAALALPTPLQFVSGLDLECFNTPGPALNIQMPINQLNPVLIALGVPSQVVVIRELQQTCVPVVKNGVLPAPEALPFIRHVDLACFRVDAPLLPTFQTLTLRHLNPVLAGLPAHMNTLIQAVQLCIPVYKNGVALPPDEHEVARFVDLACYRTDPGAHPNFAVQLRQLNPQLVNIPPHVLQLGPQNRQVCVPVRKANQPIPAATLNLVRWLDLEKFQATPVALPAMPVFLQHLNPFFTNLPGFQVILQQATHLMVPVSKNGQTPPG